MCFIRNPKVENALDLRFGAWILLVSTSRYSSETNVQFEHAGVKRSHWAKISDVDDYQGRSSPFVSVCDNVDMLLIV